MADKDLLTNRLKELNKNKENLKKDKPSIVNNIVTGEDEKPDFTKMAEMLNSKKEDVKSENDGYVKDTIYIRKDLYDAMQALCVRQGDKKKMVNRAYEIFLTKKYKEVIK